MGRPRIYTDEERRARKYARNAAWHREHRERIKAGLLPKPKIQYVYMYMESLESPIAIAEASTMEELAEKIGRTRGTVASAIWNVEHGKLKRSRYLRIRLDEDDEDE